MLLKLPWPISCLKIATSVSCSITSLLCISEIFSTPPSSLKSTKEISHVVLQQWLSPQSEEISPSIASMKFHRMNTAWLTVKPWTPSPLLRLFFLFNIYSRVWWVVTIAIESVGFLFRCSNFDIIVLDLHCLLNKQVSFYG